MRRREIQKQQRRALLLILFGGVLLIISVFWIGRQNAAQVASSGSGDAASLPDPGVGRISLETAKAKFDAGSAIMLDVRPVGDYATAHIPGAMSIPLAELPARFLELPLGAEILTYCT